MSPRWWTVRNATLTGFAVLGGLVLGLSALAALTGFGPEFVPNFLLNAACDMLGGLTVLFLVEPIVRSAGIGLHAHSHLDPHKLCRRVARAHEYIRILDTSSRLIGTDAKHEDRFLHALRSAVTRGAYVRILLMSPSSGASRARAGQLRERYPELDLDRRITEDIKQIRRYIDELDAPKDRIQLRLYTCPAPFILYGVDEVLLYTTVPHDMIADDSPHVEVHAETPLGQHLLERFDDLWESSRDFSSLVGVRFADRPEDVPMQLCGIEHGGDLFLISTQLDRALEYMDEPWFLIDGNLVARFRAQLVQPGTGLHSQLFEALKQRDSSSKPRTDQPFYRMVEHADAQQAVGRTEAFRHLPTQHLTARIREARREIRILDTSSTLLLGQGHEPDSWPIFATLLQALQNGTRVRVLLMYPGSASTLSRVEEIGRPSVESEILDNLRLLDALRQRLDELESWPGLIEVALYDRPPSFSVYQVDDLVISGFMPYGARSSVTPHFGACAGYPLAAFALGQFDRLWEEADVTHLGVHQLSIIANGTVAAFDLRERRRHFGARPARAVHAAQRRARTRSSD